METKILLFRFRFEPLKYNPVEKKITDTKNTPRKNSPNSSFQTESQMSMNIL